MRSFAFLNAGKMQDKRIKTPLGSGSIIGVEFPKSKTIKRYIVRLDNETLYKDNIAAFFTKQITEE